MQNFTVNTFLYFFSSSSQFSLNNRDLHVLSIFCIFLATANWFASSERFALKVVNTKKVVDVSLVYTSAEEVSLVEPAYRTELSRAAIHSRDFTVILGTIIEFYVKIYFLFYY